MWTNNPISSSSCGTLENIVNSKFWEIGQGRARARARAGSHCHSPKSISPAAAAMATAKTKRCKVRHPIFSFVVVVCPSVRPPLYLFLLSSLLIDRQPDSSAAERESKSSKTKTQQSFPVLQSSFVFLSRGQFSRPSTNFMVPEERPTDHDDSLLIPLDTLMRMRVIFQSERVQGSSVFSLFLSPSLSL